MSQIWCLCLSRLKLLKMHHSALPDHSGSDWWILFRNWFWYLIVVNRSNALLILISKGPPVFALFVQGHKIKKANKVQQGQWRPTKGSIAQNFKFFVIITIQGEIINKCEYNTKKCVFKKVKIFIFITQIFWNYILLNMFSIPIIQWYWWKQ